MGPKRPKKMNVKLAFPTVRNCCFFMPLRWGSLIIALISLFVGGPGCMLFFVRGCIMFGALSSLYYVQWFLCILVFVTAIIFIVGMCCMESPLTAEIFFWSLFLANVVSLIIILLSGIMGMIQYGCSFPIVGTVLMLINFAIGIYFVIVVRSFRLAEM